MMTHELNHVSSPTVARLENFESSRFFSLARTAVTQYRSRRVPLTQTMNLHRHSPFCILHSFIEMAGLKTLEKPGFLTPASPADDTFWSAVASEARHRFRHARWYPKPAHNKRQCWS